MAFLSFRKIGITDTETPLSFKTWTSMAMLLKPETEKDGIDSRTQDSRGCLRMSVYQILLG